VDSRCCSSLFLTGTGSFSAAACGLTAGGWTGVAASENTATLVGAELPRVVIARERH
jgi:hypothetical protein